MIKQQTKKPRQQKQATLKKSRKSENSQKELTFLEHIYEVRNRLFWIVTVLVVTSAAGFQYKDILVDFIMAPLHGEKLIYLTPGGGFSFIFTVCLYFGALLTIPVVIYHLYGFLQPVLGRTSRRFITAIVLLSAFLAASGAIFGYTVAIPAAINFLTTFAGDAVSPNLTADSYLSFVVMYLLGLAALFQLPLILFIFDHVRPFPPGTLLSSQRFVIVGAVIAAALITPTPDMINQMIVAGPIIVIYQLGALAIYLRRRAERRSTAKRAKASAMAYQPPKRSALPANKPAVVHAALSPDTAHAAVPQSKRAIPKQPVTSTAVKVPSHNTRSIDGFGRKQSRTVVVVPARRPVDAMTTRQAATRTSSARRHVSLDGFTIASKA